MARRYGPLDVIANVFGTAAYFAGRHSYGTTRRTHVAPPRLGGGAGRIGWRGASRFFRQGKAGLMPMSRMFGGGRGRKSAGIRGMGAAYEYTPARHLGVTRQMLSPMSSDYAGNAALASFLTTRRGMRGRRMATASYIRGGHSPQGIATRMARVARVSRAKVERYQGSLGPGYAAMSRVSKPFRPITIGLSHFTPHDIQTNVRKMIKPRVMKTRARVSASQFSRKTHRTKKQKIQQTGPVQVKQYTRMVKGKSVRVKGFTRKRGRRR